MSGQEINNAGRDQYNITGDKTKLKVDNRVSVGANRKLVIEIATGVVVTVIAGYILFRFGWN